MSASNLSMGINQEKIICLKVSHSNSLKYYNYEVSSSNPDVLEVTDEAIVKVSGISYSNMAELYAQGKAGTETVTLRVGNKTAACRVTVQEN